LIRIFRHYISSVFLWLFFAEFGIFLAAMYYGSNLRFLFAESWYTEEYVLIASFIFATVLSLCLTGIGLYRRTLARDDYDLFPRMAVGFAAAIVILVSIYYFFPQFQIARSVLAFAFAFAFLGLVISRLLFYRYTREERLKRRVLLVGHGRQAQKVIDTHTGYLYKGFEVVRCLAIEGEKPVVDRHLVIEGNENIMDVVKQDGIDEVVIALDDRRRNLPVDQLLDCKMSGVDVLDLLSFYERENSIINLDNLYPSWLIFSDGFATGGYRVMQKRLLDILASLVLLAVAWPFMLLTAMAIFLESGWKEPIFYRQLRVGEQNRNFSVLKFRSMRTDAEKDGVKMAKRQDDRVTQVGRFIRKYRIDELTQIFNVLRGQMSFVGPRPERPEFVEKFVQTIPYYRERHRVKPGITGWAQLCYPYGENEYDAIQKLQYDLYYVKNYSLFLDLNIIMHTIEVVLWGKGGR